MESFFIDSHSWAMRSLKTNELETENTGPWYNKKDVDKLEAENKKQSDILDKSNKASTLLVGSEYFGDPAYTIKTLENMVRRKSDSIMKAIRDRKKVEAENKEFKDSIKVALACSDCWRIPNDTEYNDESSGEGAVLEDMYNRFLELTPPKEGE